MLSAVLPVHIIESILSQMENDTPKVFVEHHAQIRFSSSNLILKNLDQLFSAVCARIYGLHAVLQQINVQVRKFSERILAHKTRIQEAGRLLNDLDRRIWILANFHQVYSLNSINENKAIQKSR